MTEKIRKLIFKNSPTCPPTATGVCHYVVGPYLYARHYVVEKWGNKFLYYFSSSKAFIPLSPTVCFMTPRSLTYKKLLEIIRKNRVDIVAVEEEVLRQMGFIPKVPPVEEFIVVSQTEKEEIKKEFPIATLHKLSVKEVVKTL